MVYRILDSYMFRFFLFDKIGSDDEIVAEQEQLIKALGSTLIEILFKVKLK